MSGKTFLGFMPCPVCKPKTKKDTRHYTARAGKYFKNYRTIWCDDCKVTRIQFKKEGLEEGM